MRARLRRFAWPAVGLCLAALALATFVGLFWQPRARLLATLQGLQRDVQGYESALERHASIRASLTSLGATMLGQATDLVDARFRSELNELASQAGLEGIRVSTREPKAFTNPVGQASLRSDLDTKLRKQIDAMAIEGELVGTGTLEQSLRCLAVVQAQPWVHRMSTMAIKPMAADRRDFGGSKGAASAARFEVRLGVTTLYAKDLARSGTSDGLPGRITPDAGVDSVWGPIAAKNVFVRRSMQSDVGPAPAPPSSATSEQAIVLPAAPRDRLADWRLTAVVGVREPATGSARQEAWLVHAHDGRRLILKIGDEVEQARLVEGSGDLARFELDGRVYDVTTGSTLEAPLGTAPK
jgi:hypothetical protein